MMVSPVRDVVGHKEAKTVRTVLREVVDVPQWCVVDGTFIPTQSDDGEHDVYKALKVGQMRYDPFFAPLTKGSKVWLFNDDRDWIVETIDGGRIGLLFDSKKKLQRRVVEWRFIVPMVVWSKLQAGMVIEHLATGDKWTVVDVDGEQVHMEQWCKLNKLRMTCDLKYIGSHGVRFENVFSIDRPSVTIRNMAVPFGNNDMLIHDTRMGHMTLCVRWLLGDELAEI